MKKLTFLSIMLAAIVCLQAQTEIRVLDYVNNALFVNSSQNSRFYVGSRGGDALRYDLIIEETIAWTSEEEVVSYQANDVSNSGVVVGAKGILFDDQKPAIFENSAWTDLSVPITFIYGAAKGITPNGNKIVGWVDAGGWKMRPLLWNNKVPTILPYPLTDYLGLDDTQAIAEAISDDGKTIMGRFYTYSGLEIPLVWRYNEGSSNYDYNFVLDSTIFDYTYLPTDWEFLTDYFVDFAGFTLSGNGKYIMATLVDWSTWADIPIRIDLENGNQSFAKFEEVNGIGIGVSNDGKLTCATPGFGIIRESFIFVPGVTTEMQLMETYLSSQHSFQLVPNFMQRSGTMSITDDGKFLFGFSHNPEDALRNYIIATNGFYIGVKEQEKPNVTFYPNPVSGNHINFREMVDQVRITDLLGRSIIQTSKVNSLDLQNFAKGIYIIEIEMQGQTITQKLVKNN